MMGAEPGDVAVRYAAHGWAVMPLHTARTGAVPCTCQAQDCGSPGKHPRTRHGLHDATTDVDRVRRWWRRWPTANIAVATGQASGLVVVDVDVPDGPASLAALQAQHGRLPATCEQRTGSGGRHLLFAHPGRRTGNGCKIAPGIDVRGDGGYIVVPPSLHASGHRYRWTSSRPPAPAPAWLWQLLDRARSVPAPPPPDLPPLRLPEGTRAQRYAAAALQREVAAVAATRDGCGWCNTTLFWASVRLANFVAGGLLDVDRVRAELERAAATTGMPEREMRATIASGMAIGAKRPLTGPPDRPASNQRSSQVRRRAGLGRA